MCRQGKIIDLCIDAKATSRFTVLWWAKRCFPDEKERENLLKDLIKVLQSFLSKHSTFTKWIETNTNYRIMNKICYFFDDINSLKLSLNIINLWLYFVCL